MESRDWERLVESLVKEGVLCSTAVIKAMYSVPRRKFLAKDMQSYSAADTPLPIGFGQTISAPHNLAFMQG